VKLRALISRRSLIASGVAVGMVGFGAGLVRLGPACDGMRVLSRAEVDIVEAVTAVLFPPGFFPVAGGDGGTAPILDVLMSEDLAEEAVVGFRYLLRAIELGTLVSRGRSFSALSLDEARSVLEVWSSAAIYPRRLASDSLQVVLGMAFFRRPEVSSAIGWRAGCHQAQSEVAALIEVEP